MVGVGRGRLAGGGSVFSYLGEGLIQSSTQHLKALRKVSGRSGVPDVDDGGEGVLLTNTNGGLVFSSNILVYFSLCEEMVL